MSTEPEIIVLCGAVSPERAVSLRSGAACAEALQKTFAKVRLVVLDENSLPAGLDPSKHVIFPVIHGDFGEDGRLQKELEQRGFAYAGCDSAVSALCIDKVATKVRVRAAGVPVAPEVAFSGTNRPRARAVTRRLGRNVVVKPSDKGSSVGLHMVSGSRALGRIIGRLRKGNWMAEPRLRGRELTVGLLDGKAMGIVEIVPKSGDYDYRSKYTAGATQYLFPAPLAESTAAAIRTDAEKLFSACGCRDFARADVILLPSGKYYFLEVNTIPGLTATSLLPKSASCAGLDFPALVRRMIEPALRRREASAK